MRKVILQEFVSLDGAAADRDGGVDFIPATTEGDQAFRRRQMAFLHSIDTILLGRVTYEMFAAYWPNVTSGEEKVFADQLNATPRVVFSKTLDRAPWGTWNESRIVRGHATEEVAKLRKGPGKDMVIWGSISLAQSLMHDGLIDEYQLMVCPVVLGGGKALFRERTDVGSLQLVETKAFNNAFVLLSYKRT